MEDLIRKPSITVGLLPQGRIQAQTAISYFTLICNGFAVLPSTLS